eukprot:364297-Chlamydomonas_euryale.AAC.4
MSARTKRLSDNMFNPVELEFPAFPAITGLAINSNTGTPASTERHKFERINPGSTQCGTHITGNSYGGAHAAPPTCTRSQRHVCAKCASCAGSAAAHALWRPSCGPLIATTFAVSASTFATCSKLSSPAQTHTAQQPCRQPLSAVGA